MTALRLESVRDTFSAGLGHPVPAGLDGAGAPVVDVPREQWTEAAHLARHIVGLDFLDWLSAVDAPDGDPPGVDVVLHVAQASKITRRLLLRTRVPETDLRLPSLTSFWPGVAWHERETFEMFGVGFDGFDDGTGLPIRPLLLPDGFEGTPLRKSFVLAARASKAWPGAKEPGESDSSLAAVAADGSAAPKAAPRRRTAQPPGVPDPAVWGREP